MSAFIDLLAPHDGTPTCNAHWIGKQLGHDGSAATLEDYLETLIAEAGFPRPLPHRKHGGGLSFEVSYARSQWIRLGVVQWLEDFLPPPASAALEEKAFADAADEMDAAAQSLTLVASNDAHEVA